MQSKPARQLEQCGGFQVSSIVAQQVFLALHVFTWWQVSSEELLWFNLNIKV